MIPGYNHNIKYKGRVYHVQTEDNGRSNPYIVSHLFIGGNIIASKRTSYLDISLNENAQSITRDMMQEQHKTMVKDLLSGAYDNLLKQQSPKPPIPTMNPPPPEKSSLPLDVEKVSNTEKSLDEIILEFLSKDKR